MFDLSARVARLDHAVRRSMECSFLIRLHEDRTVTVTAVGGRSPIDGKRVLQDDARLVLAVARCGARSTVVLSDDGGIYVLVHETEEDRKEFADTLQAEGLRDLLLSLPTMKTTGERIAREAQERNDR